MTEPPVEHYTFDSPPAVWSRPNHTIAAFACLPRVLKRGIIISGHENHKARGYETITIGAAIKLNGQRVNMAVVVKVDKKSNKYKVHRILTPNNSKVSFNEKTEPTPSGAAKEAVTPTIGSVYSNSISQSDSKSNSSSQQNSDRFKDIDYLSAIERGDMETAQKMVDEAAEKAGYDLHLYHGSKSGGGFLRDLS